MRTMIVLVLMIVIVVAMITPVAATNVIKLFIYLFGLKTKHNNNKNHYILFVRPIPLAWSSLQSSHSLSLYPSPFNPSAHTVRWPCPPSRDHLLNLLLLIVCTFWRDRDRF